MVKSIEVFSNQETTDFLALDISETFMYHGKVFQRVPPLEFFDSGCVRSFKKPGQDPQVYNALNLSELSFAYFDANTQVSPIDISIKIDTFDNDKEDNTS